jgi:hypothetical protein
MTNGTSSALNSEQDLASIPMAGGGLSRLAIARLKSAGVPVAPLLRRAGLAPEVIADPEERLSVRSQVALLDEAAIALRDDCLGFTLARDFDPREIGNLDARELPLIHSDPHLNDLTPEILRSGVSR